MTSISQGREPKLERMNAVTANKNDTLDSDTMSENRAAPIEATSLEDANTQRSEDTPPSFKDNERETPYISIVPFAKGEKVLETFDVEEHDFIPRQQPRTSDHNMPESQCSNLPIGPVKLRLFRLSTELHGEVYDTVAIVCLRQEETIGSLMAFIARRDRPSPVFSNHLLSIYEEDGRLLPPLLASLESVGSGAWGAELDKGDVMFIDNIGVLDWWEGLGIGRKMVDMVLEKAKKFGISWVFTYPHSWNHRERRARAGQLDLAIDYWRSMGFRRVGDLVYFCYSIDPAHPSHSITAEQDFDPPER